MSTKLTYVFSFVLATFAVALANPFQSKPLYVTSRFRSEVERSMKTAEACPRAALSRLLSVSTALWIDTIKVTHMNETDPNTVYGALARAATKSPSPMITFVVYNLPNRDCSASASSGEISCKSEGNVNCSTCSCGLKRYREQYIDPIATVVGKFCSLVPMSFIIEPDALANIVTNQGSGTCGSTETLSAYRQGIAYAVNKLHESCPKAAFYIDAAHGGWLGWDGNADGFAREIQGMNIWRKLRGFSINVSNYQPLGTRCPTVGMCNGGRNADHPCCKNDPCGLSGQYNPGFTELNYADQLSLKVKGRLPEFNPRFVIDTSRNGVEESREKCSNWCNIRRAGLGKFPTTETGHQLVDAFLWVKTPSQSDGCTARLPNGSQCPRYDEACSSSDSLGSLPGEPRIPEAGEYSPYQLQQLVENANLLG